MYYIHRYTINTYTTINLFTINRANLKLRSTEPNYASTNRTHRTQLKMDKKDPISQRYEQNIRLMLANRCMMNREQLLNIIHRYVQETFERDEQKVFNDTACNTQLNKSTKAMLNNDFVRALNERQKLRTDNFKFDVEETKSLAERYNIDQLNRLLAILDELTHDIIDLIELNEKTGLAPRVPSYQTVNKFIPIVSTILKII